MILLWIETAFLFNFENTQSQGILQSSKKTIPPSENHIKKMQIKRGGLFKETQ